MFKFLFKSSSQTTIAENEVTFFKLLSVRKKYYNLIYLYFNELFQVALINDLKNVPVISI